MLLYRPRAITYEDAMKQVLLFDDLPEMNRFLRNYHNLPEQSTTAGSQPILRADCTIMEDHRNGWLSSQYICIGNYPIGIFDRHTLESIKRPRYDIMRGLTDGYECHFHFIDKDYSFHVGIDTWEEISRCLGYCHDKIIFRQDHVSVDRETLSNIVRDFIIRTAMNHLKSAAKSSSGIL